MWSGAYKSEVKVFKFGVDSLSDVIFVVDDHEFHCHKMALATRFPYFNTMFTSDFKEKTEKRIEIKADPTTFKRFMQILYNGIFEDYEKFFSRIITGSNNESRCQGLWSESCALFELADRFLVFDVVRKIFESYMIRANGLCCGGSDCNTCAVKLLLSLRFQMDDYKGICKANCSAICSAIYCLEQVQKEYTLSSAAMTFLLNRY